MPGSSQDPASAKDSNGGQGAKAPDRFFQKQCLISDKFSESVIKDNYSPKSRGNHPAGTPNLSEKENEGMAGAPL